MNFETENYFKALVESLPDIVWSFDKNYLLTAANGGFFELRRNAYNSDIKIGDSFFKDVSEAGIQKWKPIYEKVLNGERLIMEDERDLNRQHTFVNVSLNPVYNDEREVTGCMGITYDVTRIVELETALNQNQQVIDKLIKNSDYKITPIISKIIGLSEQINNTSINNTDDISTMLFMLNNELLVLNKELNQLKSITNGAKNL